MKISAAFITALLLMPAHAKAAAAAAPRSWTLVHFLPGDFRDFHTRNLMPALFPAGVFAVDDSSRPAVLTSAGLDAVFPFDELLLSADAVFPGGGELEAEAQVKTAEGWSPWFSFGRFNAAGGGISAAPQENSFGRLEIDLLKLKKKASALRYRLTVTPAGGTPRTLAAGSEEKVRGKTPLIRLAAVSYTDSGAPYSHADAAARPAGFKALKLALPRRSQMIQQVNYAGDICSPVSLSMALCGLGLRAEPLETAEAVLDSAQNIYGNWFFNTAHAGARGLYAFVARLNSLEEARAFLDAGAQVVASVTFGPDELRNSPLKKTKGHLLVLAGFTAKGDVITHDPAAPDEKTVERIYDRAQFAQAWLKNKYGTAYIIAKDLNRFLAVKENVAELYSMPPGPGADERAKLIESQLLFNERVELIEVSGTWARATAAEQVSLQADRKTLAPYQGWLPLESLAFSLPAPYTAVVKTKTARSGGVELSVGVRLRVIGGAGGARAFPPGGPALSLAEKDLNALPQKTSAADQRAGILGTARVFLGDKYYWGGRSAWGIDCSGLVNLAYRAWGLELPRNADDQYAASRSVSRENLMPADLIFSAEASKPGLINHVMLYAGGGRLIEATGDSNSVREISFSDKFGSDFRKSSNGMVSGGKKIFFRKIIN
ncbi:MAG: NlpC/P60 family protein [Elusimicrobiota bacterium]|nr:NlpC/P60 family protein [Elusimicrobiota bacterium]